MVYATPRLNFSIKMAVVKALNWKFFLTNFEKQYNRKFQLSRKFLSLKKGKFLLNYVKLCIFNRTSVFLFVWGAAVVVER